MALDWAEKDCSVTSPIVIILPGLTGGSQAEYIKCLVSAARKIGIRCVIFNNRGLGGMTLKVWPFRLVRNDYKLIGGNKDSIPRTNSTSNRRLTLEHFLPS